MKKVTRTQNYSNLISDLASLIEKRYTLCSESEKCT